MVIAPCGIRIEQLVERQRKARDRNKARREQKLKAKQIPPDVAREYARQDTAILLALELLERVERNEPGALERNAHPPQANTPATSQ